MKESQILFSAKEVLIDWFHSSQTLDSPTLKGSPTQKDGACITAYFWTWGSWVWRRETAGLFGSNQDPAW